MANKWQVYCQIKQQEMVLKVLALILFYGAVGYSGFQILGLLDEHGGELKHENFVKFQFLFYMHIFAAVSIIPLLKLEEFYHQILYSFFVFLALFMAFFACEKITHGQTNQQDELLNEFDQLKVESSFYDLYYLIYTCVVMGLVVTGFFIVISEAVNCWRGPPVSRYDGILVPVDFSQSMRRQECSICLTEFTKEQKYLAIKKCNHIFHQDCLKEWIKYNKICPLDRVNIMP